MGKLMNLLAGNRDVILYRKDLNKITGSVTASILLQQILFRWESNGNKEFYKFKEPCDHELYRDGDSWCEELGFSRSEFDTARDVIASKFSNNVPKDPFALVWYRVDSSRITQYFVNEPLLELLLDLMLDEDVSKSKSQLYVKRESHFTKSEFPALVLYSTETTTENPLTPNGGTPDHGDEPTNTKAKPKRNGAVSSPPAREDFLGFANPDMAMEIWEEWVQYKKDQHKFTYKSDHSVRLGIAKLLAYSDGSIQKARAIIHDAMANGYKGFFQYEDKMAKSAQVPEKKPQEDNYQLEAEMQSKYERATEWFFKNCHLCKGIRWLSKEEYEKVQNKDSDFIGAMWKYHCVSTEFGKKVQESLLALNRLPRWDKDKWQSVYEWLKKDVSDRIFPRQK